jgi:hypothetical protein
MRPYETTTTRLVHSTNGVAGPSAILGEMGAIGREILTVSRQFPDRAFAAIAYA